MCRNPEKRRVNLKVIFQKEIAPWLHPTTQSWISTWKLWLSQISLRERSHLGQSVGIYRATPSPHFATCVRYIYFICTTASATISNILLNSPPKKVFSRTLSFFIFFRSSSHTYHHIHQIFFLISLLIYNLYLPLLISLVIFHDLL